MISFRRLNNSELSVNDYKLLTEIILEERASGSFGGSSVSGIKWSKIAEELSNIRGATIIKKTEELVGSGISKKGIFLSYMNKEYRLIEDELKYLNIELSKKEKEVFRKPIQLIYSELQKSEAALRRKFSEVDTKKESKLNPRLEDIAIEKYRIFIKQKGASYHDYSDTDDTPYPMMSALVHSFSNYFLHEFWRTDLSDARRVGFYQEIDGAEVSVENLITDVRTRGVGETYVNFKEIIYELRRLDKIIFSMPKRGEQRSSIIEWRKKGILEKKVSRLNKAFKGAMKFQGTRKMFYIKESKFENTQDIQHRKAQLNDNYMALAALEDVVSTISLNNYFVVMNNYMDEYAGNFWSPRVLERSPENPNLNLEYRAKAFSELLAGMKALYRLENQLETWGLSIIDFPTRVMYEDITRFDDLEMCLKYGHLDEDKNYIETFPNPKELGFTNLFEDYRDPYDVLLKSRSVDYNLNLKKEYLDELREQKIVPLNDISMLYKFNQNKEQIENRGISEILDLLEHLKGKEEDTVAMSGIMMLIKENLSFLLEYLRNPGKPGNKKDWKVPLTRLLEEDEGALADIVLTCFTIFYILVYRLGREETSKYLVGISEETVADLNRSSIGDIYAKMLTVFNNELDIRMDFDYRHGDSEPAVGVTLYEVVQAVLSEILQDTLYLKDDLGKICREDYGVQDTYKETDETCELLSYRNIEFTLFLYELLRNTIDELEFLIDVWNTEYKEFPDLKYMNLHHAFNKSMYLELLKFLFDVHTKDNPNSNNLYKHLKTIGDNEEDYGLTFKGVYVEGDKDVLVYIFYKSLFELSFSNKGFEDENYSLPGGSTASKLNSVFNLRSEIEKTCEHLFNINQSIYPVEESRVYLKCRKALIDYSANAQHDLARVNRNLTKEVSDWLKSREVDDLGYVLRSGGNRPLMLRVRNESQINYKFVHSYGQVVTVKPDNGVFCIGEDLKQVEYWML